MFYWIYYLCSPGKFLTEWCDLVQSGCAPKYVITHLKINNFKEKIKKENLIALFLSQTNPDKHLSTKVNTFRIFKGGLGGLPPPPPPKQKEFFKKSIKMEAFPFYFFFFAFWQAPYIPKIMRLLPSSP